MAVTILRTWFTTGRVKQYKCLFKVTEGMVKIGSSTRRFIQKVVRDTASSAVNTQMSFKPNKALQKEINKRTFKPSRKKSVKINSYNRNEQREIPKQSRASLSTFTTSEPQSANNAVQPHTFPQTTII